MVIHVVALETTFTFVHRTRGPQAFLAPIHVGTVDQDLAVSPKKSLTLCIAHYLNTKQDSGWVATHTGLEPVTSSVTGWRSTLLN